MNKIGIKANEVIAPFLAILILLLIPLAEALAAVQLQKPIPFDHSKTGFVLMDVHATLKCEQCHVDGIFKNTPKDCAGCHTTGTRVAATPKPINHVPTTSPCDTCHVSAANFLVKSYKHVGITGNCATCHDGQSLGVMSKPANHFPTKLPCESCHRNTSTFLSWQMDHTGVTGGCFACHGGPAGEPGAVGTYPGVTSFNVATHFPLTNSAAPIPPDCIACHTSFSSFLGATYTHTGVSPGTCGTCHQNQYPNVVSINPARHLPQTSGNACDTCHIGYASFLGAVFTHTLGSVCSTCHQGQYPGIVSIDTTVHIPLPAGSTCSNCHTDPATVPGSLPTFLGVLFHTTSFGTSPTGTCRTCHNGSYVSQNASAQSPTHIPATADCGTCHTGPSGTNTTLGYTTFLNVKFHQTPVGNPPAGSCSTCHNGGYVAAGALAKNTGHVTTTADCVACHTTSNTQTYTTFLGASFAHTPGVYAVFPAAPPASPLCGSCHNGATATGKASGHVLTSGDCLACHTNVTTGCPNCQNFYGVIYSHINGVAGVAAYTVFPSGPPASPTCMSCHNGATSQASGLSAGHIPTAGADCITCHTPATTGCANAGNCSTFLGAIFNHSTVTAGSCGTCHQGQYANVVSINTAIHIPQTSGNACDACHTNAITNILTSPTPTFLNVVFHRNALGNPPAGTCTVCHSGTYTSQNAQGKPAGHVATTADCVTCHTATNTSSYTTFLGAGYNHSPGTYASWPPSSTPTPACSSCHNGVTATGTNAGHPSITSDCMACHAPVLVGCPMCSSFGIPAAANHDAAFLAANPVCKTCHNGTTATGLSADAGHIPIGALDCGQCHPAYNGTTSINFSTGAVATVGTSLTYKMKHTGLTSRCDACHNGSYTSQGIYGALAKVSNHIPTTLVGSLDCNTCHTTLTLATINVASGAADWNDVTNSNMNHNGISGGAPNYCVTCHLSSAPYLAPGIQKSSHNGASTSKDCSSSSCHRPLGRTGAAYSSWGG